MASDVRGYRMFEGIRSSRTSGVRGYPTFGVDVTPIATLFEVHQFAALCDIVIACARLVSRSKVDGCVPRTRRVKLRRDGHLSTTCSRLPSPRFPRRSKSCLFRALGFGVFRHALRSVYCVRVMPHRDDCPDAHPKPRIPNHRVSMRHVACQSPP